MQPFIKQSQETTLPEKCENHIVVACSVLHVIDIEIDICIEEERENERDTTLRSKNIKQKTRDHPKLIFIYVYN